MDYQPELIQPEQLPPRLRWEALLAFVPAWPQAPAQYGRKPYDRSALLKALIYQRLTRRRFLQDLYRHLLETPPILAALGFDPYRLPPSVERFCSFLADTEPTHLQSIRTQLVRTLLDLGVIRACHLGLDSCPIISWVRENNLKLSLCHKRFDKTSPPKGDPEAAVGVRIHYPAPGQRQVQYFWGYRNHILADLEAELPLWEITQPNSIAEMSVALPLLSSALSSLQLHPQSVCADCEYDVEAILRYILQELKAKAFIPQNPRNRDQSGFRREAQQVLCPADLPMHRHGRMTVKGNTYLQYRCPLHFGPRRHELLLCPANHPKFSEQKGCNYLWRLTGTVRDLIPYGSQEFQQHYHRRTAIERIFSRLLTITIQEPSVRGLASVRNHCTIAHIAVLLVALAAHHLGHQDKIRFITTFVPDFMSTPPPGFHPEK